MPPPLTHIAITRCHGTHACSSIPEPLANAYSHLRLMLSSYVLRWAYVVGTAFPHRCRRVLRRARSRGIITAGNKRPLYRIDATCRLPGDAPTGDAYSAARARCARFLPTNVLPAPSNNTPRSLAYITRNKRMPQRARWPCSGIADAPAAEYLSIMAWHNHVCGTCVQQCIQLALAWQLGLAAGLAGLAWFGIPLRGHVSVSQEAHAFLFLLLPPLYSGQILSLSLFYLPSLYLSLPSMIFSLNLKMRQNFHTFLRACLGGGRLLACLFQTFLCHFLPHLPFLLPCFLCFLACVHTHTAHMPFDFYFAHTLGLLLHLVAHI